MNVSITLLNMKEYVYHGHKTHFMIIVMVQTRSAAISCIKQPAPVPEPTPSPGKSSLDHIAWHEFALFFSAVMVLTVYRSLVRHAWWLMEELRAWLQWRWNRSVVESGAARSRVGRAVWCNCRCWDGCELCPYIELECHKKEEWRPARFIPNGR